MDNKTNNRSISFSDNSHIDGYWNNSGPSFNRIKKSLRINKGIFSWITNKIKYGKLRRKIL